MTIHEESLSSTIELSQSTAPPAALETPKPLVSVPAILPGFGPPKVETPKSGGIHKLKKLTVPFKVVHFSNGDQITVPGCQTDIAHDFNVVEETPC